MSRGAQIALGLAIVTSVLVAAGCRSDGGADGRRGPLEVGDESVQAIDGALTLPTLNGEGDRLAYLSIRDGLVSSTVMDSISGEELWAGPSSYFRGELGSLERPLVVGSAMYVNTFEEATLDASISRIDMVTGSVTWTAELGPHYGSPFECGTELVCVHAHPSVAPVSTYRFDRSSGERSEGSVGRTTVYADTEVLISEDGSRIVASQDAGVSETWSVEIADAFGEQVSTAGGSWSERFGDRVVLWLGSEDTLAGRAVAFDVSSGSFEDVTGGRPCLIPLNAALGMMCLVTDDEIVLVNSSGSVLAVTSNELDEDVIVPPHVFDAAGEVVVQNGAPLRVGSSGFTRSELPDRGWCPHEPEAAQEPAQGPNVAVSLPRRFFPCDLRSSRPLDASAARDLALAAAESANAHLLVAQAGDSIAYFDGPKRLVLTSR